MKLTELLYPFAFLPVCLVLYYVLPKRCRNVILLAASLLFFAWGTPEYGWPRELRRNGKFVQ